MRELVEAVTGRPGYSSHVGTRVGAVSAGKVEMILQRRPELLQIAGYFHGGVISGLADHAAGAAVASALSPGSFCLTVGLTINFLSPADGESLAARAEAIKVSGSICTADVKVWSAAADGAETLCATALVTLRAINMPQDAGPLLQGARDAG